MLSIQTSYRPYPFGIIVSLLLAVSLGTLVFATVVSPDWGGLIFTLATVWIFGPLARRLIIAWIHYMIRDKDEVLGRVHALLMFPTPIALLPVQFALVIAYIVR